MLTEVGDLVEEYLDGALGRFPPRKVEKYPAPNVEKSNGDNAYRVFKPGVLWNGVDDDEPLLADGGAKRLPVAKHHLAEARPNSATKRTSAQLTLLDRTQSRKRGTGTVSRSPS